MRSTKAFNCTLEKLGKSKFGFERTAASNFKSKRRKDSGNEVVDYRPFPSSLVPLFQSESKCETILLKMTLICMKKKLRAELIFI